MENLSTRRKHIVAISGSATAPSKTTELVKAISQRYMTHFDADLTLIEINKIGPGMSGALTRADLSPAIENVLEQIEHADLLVVGSPVYRGSYTGLFKHLFDFVDQFALVEKPVMLAASGGSERHSLIIDHQMRPLFAFFQCNIAPLGIYASESDFQGSTVSSEALVDRIELAVDLSVRALPKSFIS